MLLNFDMFLIPLLFFQLLHIPPIGSAASVQIRVLSVLPHTYIYYFLSHNELLIDLYVWSSEMRQCSTSRE